MKPNLSYFFKNLLRLAVTMVLPPCGTIFICFLLDKLPFVPSADLFISFLFVFALFIFLTKIIATYGWYKPILKAKTLPDSLLIRYLHFFIPPILSLAFLLSYIAFTKVSFKSSFDLLFVFIIFIFGLWEFVTILAFWLCFVIGANKAGITNASKQRGILIPILASFFLLSATLALPNYQRRNLLPSNGDFRIVLREISAYYFTPFAEDSLTPKADFDASLTIDKNYPRLDGDISFMPAYTTLAETLYAGLDEKTAYPYINNKTSALNAFTRLIRDQSDLIFCLEPTKEQWKEAEKAGVELLLTPVFKEAFVFFANENNPVTDVSQEQIQNIYRNKIKNWSELGGLNHEILSFQELDHSRLQAFMQNNVMNGHRLMGPPIEIPWNKLTSGSFQIETAKYRNETNALGFSFRYNAAVLNEQLGIRVLDINGISPSAENIKNNTYPFILPVYAITTEKGLENPNTQKILDWLSSPEGHRLIELCDYVP